MNSGAAVPNAARVYDFYLGGQDAYAADRELARKILAIRPGTADVCWATGPTRPNWMMRRAAAREAAAGRR